MVLLVLLFLAGATGAAGGTAADLARELRSQELDPAECYRVRDITLVKEDARLFFTEGYLMFAKPVGGRRVAAVFSTDVEAGDGELLLMPNLRSERESLAAHTGSPNLNEHFRAAVLVFTDGTYETLLRDIREGPGNKRTPEAAALMGETWNPVLRNLVSSFESRLVLDLLSERKPADGMFASSVSGQKLGNFDLLLDPRSAEQLTVGQVTTRGERTFFDIWTSLETRSFRSGARKRPDPEIEVKNFRIDASLAPDLRMSAITRVTVRPAAASRVLPFDLSRQMRVTAASVNGSPVEVYRRDSLRSSLIRNTDNELVLLVGDRTYEAGWEYEVEIRHEGEVVTQAAKQVYSVMSRANWFPTRGSQFAIFDLAFRYPKHLDLVASGEPAGESTDGEFKITRRKTEVPVRFAGFNLGVYNRTRLTRAGAVIEVCANRTPDPSLEPHARTPVVIPQQVFRRPGQILAPPESMAPAPPVLRLAALAGEVASALEFMAARFGPPPLRTLTVSPVPGAWGQGFPGLLYLSTIAYLSPADRIVTRMSESQQVFFADILQAHETAHQWWGNLVCSRGYHDDWLMEAMANYAALLFVERRRGPRALETVLEEYRNDLLARDENGKTIESAGPIVLGARLENSLTPNAWRVITYEKGSWIVHMLRRRLGDEKFDRMLGDLLKRNTRKALSTEQVRLAAAQYLPPGFPDPKLEAFFDQWVYSTGIPKLEMSHSVRGRAPAVKLTVTVKQSEGAGDFNTLVPVEIQFVRGKSLVRWVAAGGDDNSFALALKEAPARVVLNPGSAVLARK
jgi:hypothetical protein